MKDSREWKFGSIGEQIVRDWLRRNGYTLLNMSASNAGGAPLVEGPDGKNISLDLAVFVRGSTVFVDVKAKTKAVVYKHQVRTGFSWRHYDEYVAVQQKTGCKCFIAFIHANIQELAIGELDSVCQLEDSPGVIAKYGEPMAFWRVDSLDKYSLSHGDASKLMEISAPPKVQYAWSKDAPVTKIVQKTLFSSGDNFKPLFKVEPLNG